MGESNTGLSLHGGRGDDGRVNYDGMNTNHFFGNGGGQQRIWKFNTIGVQETVVDTGGSSAEGLASLLRDVAAAATVIGIEVTGCPSAEGAEIIAPAVAALLRRE